MKTQFSDGRTDTQYPQWRWCFEKWSPTAATAHDTDRSIRGNANRSVAPNTARTAADGPTTTTDATDAAEASVLQALLTQSTHLD
jgi:hypothetical protein